MDARQDEYDEQYELNEEGLEQIHLDVESLEDQIVDLNEVVCDKRGDPCDSFCGGAGCGHCGSALSCDAGAVPRANNAMDYARKAEKTLQEKHAAVDELLRQVSDAERTCDAAHREAEGAHSEAERAKEQSEGVRADLQELIDRISEFMAERGARPADIRAVRLSLFKTYEFLGGNLGHSVAMCLLRREKGL